MALQKIHASPLALAVGSSLESQVRGVTSMVRSLSEGVGPEARDVSSFGELHTLCVLKLAIFVRVGRYLGFGRCWKTSDSLRQESSSLLPSFRGR